MKRFSKYLILIVLIFLLPATGFAVSMGEIKVDSVLGRPLDAEITLNGVSPEQLNGITASLATADAFRRVGVRRSAALNFLRFNPRINRNGKAVIHVTSANAMSAPFLNFLVELRWSRGRLLREYSILLDSPVFEPEQPVAPVREPQLVDSAPAEKDKPPALPQSSAPKPVAAPARSQPEPEPSPPPQRAEPQPAASPVNRSTDTGGAQESVEYRTKSGDTLSSIVDRFHPGGEASLQQMMIAILRKNPQAFANENINELKTGEVLRIPDKDEANRLTKAKAVAEVKRQYALWQEYRERLSQQRSIVEAEEPSKPAAGKQEVEPAEETKAAESPAPAPKTEVTPEEVQPEVVAEAEPEPVKEPEPEPVTVVEEVAPESESEASDKLRILAAAEASEELPERQPEVAGEPEAESIETSLAFTRELAESRRLELEQLKGQIQELKSILEKQKQVIELQNDQMSALQQRLAQSDALQQQRQQQAEAANGNVTEIKFTNSYLRWVWIAAIILIVPLLLYAAYMLFLKDDVKDDLYPADFKF